MINRKLIVAQYGVFFVVNVFPQNTHNVHIPEQCSGLVRATYILYEVALRHRDRFCIKSLRLFRNGRGTEYFIIGRLVIALPV